MHANHLFHDILVIAGAAASGGSAALVFGRRDPASARLAFGCAGAFAAFIAATGISDALPATAMAFAFAGLTLPLAALAAALAWTLGAAGPLGPPSASRRRHSAAAVGASFVCGSMLAGHLAGAAPFVRLVLSKAAGALAPAHPSLWNPDHVHAAAAVLASHPWASIIVAFDLLVIPAAFTLAWPLRNGAAVPAGGDRTAPAR